MMMKEPTYFKNAKAKARWYAQNQNEIRKTSAGYDHAHHGHGTSTPQRNAINHRQSPSTESNLDPEFIESFNFYADRYDRERQGLPVDDLEDARRGQVTNIMGLNGKKNAQDSMIGHLTPGEIVIPLRHQTPEVMAKLSRQMGDDLSTYTVGSGEEHINPESGLPAFASDWGNGIPMDGYEGQEPKPSVNASKWDDNNALERIGDAAWRGVSAGWNTEDPVGFDPESKVAHRKMSEDNAFLRPVQAFNETIGYPVTAAADALSRVGQAGLHGVAALAGQGYTEATGNRGMGRRLERDLLGMASITPATTTRLNTVNTSANAMRYGTNTANTWAHNPQWLLEYPTRNQFVKNADGSINLGYIPETITSRASMNLEPGHIRMQKGLSGPQGYGARHISPDKHKRAKEAGYRDGHHVIEETAKYYDKVIEQPNHRLMAVKSGDQNGYLVVAPRDSYHGVTTGFLEERKNAGKPNRQYIKQIIKRGGVELENK